MTTKRDFISWALGITTFSPLRVRSAVKRHWICITCPVWSSMRTQSPMSSESSICSASPPSRLPRVSCIAKASTAVITADVATRLVRSTPASDSVTSNHNT
jgi:hypothetical protein